MGMDLFPMEIYFKYGGKNNCWGKTSCLKTAHISVLPYTTNAHPSLSNTGPCSPSLPGDIRSSIQIRSEERWDKQLPSGVEGSSAPSHVAKIAQAVWQLLLQGSQAAFRRLVRPLLYPLVMIKKKKHIPKHICNMIKQKKINAKNIPEWISGVLDLAAVSDIGLLHSPGRSLSLRVPLSLSLISQNIISLTLG